jgi:hypothetical protein
MEEVASAAFVPRYPLGTRGTLVSRQPACFVPTRGKTMSRTEEFMSHLRAELLARYGDASKGLDGWASDPAKLERFMGRVAQMFEHKAYLVNINSPSFVAAWRALGNKGKPTYKGLFQL